MASFCQANGRHLAFYSGPVSSPISPPRQCRPRTGAGCILSRPILLALSSTLLLLADWLRGRLRGRAGILAAYLLFVAAVAGIGALIGSLLLQPVLLLPLKLVIFIHLLLALGLLVYTLGALLALALARLYGKSTGRAAGPVLRLALNMFSLAAIYGLAQPLNHWLPLAQ